MEITKEKLQELGWECRGSACRTVLTINERDKVNLMVMFLKSNSLDMVWVDGPVDSFYFSYVRTMEALLKLKDAMEGR